MSKNFDIGKYVDKFFGDMPEMLNIIADIVKVDIEKGINVSKDIHGQGFKPLKAATIKAKRKKGAAHPSRPLEDTGKMKVVYVKQRATKNKPEAIVTIPKIRGDVGVYHNLGGTTVKGRPPLREWFGISVRADKKTDKWVKQWLLSH